MLGMDQMYKMALDPRIYPDSRLLSIMQGKDQSLPMAIAMAAKQQRDKLTQASQGQQAEQGSKQPSVKDQMLAKDLPPEHSGLAALPAENMHDMGSEQMMAGGGIVAFSGLEDSLVELNKQAKSDDDTKNEWLQNAKKNPPAPSTPSFLDTLPARLADKRSSTTDAAIAQANADAAAQDKVAGIATPTGQTNPLAITPEMQAEINRRSAANPPGGQKAPGGAPPGQGGAAANAAQAQAGIGQPPQRVDRFAGLGETQDAFNQKIANEKNAGFSDMLMNMGLTMMTTTGSLGKAIGAGGIAGLPSLAASRKTINALEKNREDYQLNMAKYRTAADEGNDELAYKYKALADQTAYHSGLLAVEKTKAGAYANAVGSREDIRKDKFDTAVMKGATDIHQENMKNLLFQQKFAKMSPEDQQQYFASLRQQASQLAGKDTGGGGLGSGISTAAIDAAIARKQTQ